MIEDARKEIQVMMKKVLRKVCISTMILAMVLSSAIYSFGAVGLNVDVHSPEEIRSFYNKVYTENDFRVLYDTKPVFSNGPYKAGSLSASTLKGAVDVLNLSRYIAGIPYNVELKDEYNRWAQAGALVNAANNVMSHNPKQPKDMDFSLYQLGKKGCGSSNLFYGTPNFETAVNGWISDENNRSGFNQGHRRWCLNPNMKYTGFGKAGVYSAMYCFDSIGKDTPYKGVAWPAQNMPANLFSTDFAWTVSFDRDINKSGVEVLLVRVADGRKWNFNSRNADGQFDVDNNGYGQKGCVIFLPDQIKSYNAGDVYRVTIRENGNIIAEYYVNFFDLKTRPEQILELSLRSTWKNQIKVTWGQVNCDGYRIEYSRSSNFRKSKAKLVYGEENTSAVLKNLKKGKAYYIRVVAFNLEDGYRAFGTSYSPVAKIVCK